LAVFHSSATALPGLIILRLYPRFLEETIGRYPDRTILVTGTNGKTTTTHLLVHLLRKSGKRVFHNPEGSNMERGIASEVLKCISFYGRPRGAAPTNNKSVGVDPCVNPLPFDFFVIESDEGSFSKLLSILKPRMVILLNIFRDQLDRYGEINTLMDKWSSALQKYPPGKIIFNADDPNITRIVSELHFDDLNHRSHGFSVVDSTGEGNTIRSADRLFCPQCNNILKFTENNFYCEQCRFKKVKAEYVLKENSKLEFNHEPIGLPIFGKYNYYNLAGALTAYFNVGGDLRVAPHADKPGGLSLQELLQDFRPAFGRFEKIKYKNHFFHVVLAKNPAGMDNVLTSLQGDIQPTNLLMCLNDKIADGEDVSWIYDVDYENLFSVGAEHVQPLRLTFSGTRAHDLDLRLKIAEKLPETYTIEPEMQTAFENFLKDLENGEVSVVIVTYTCLLELQKIMYKKGMIKKIM
jgi:UDP-N-acetylmuramyl tripeptide synthase